jgi:hypothetical protein
MAAGYVTRLRDLRMPDRRMAELSMNPPLETKGGAPAKPKADPSRFGARDDNNVGVNKNAGLKPGMINKREARSRSLTLNETCQNPDGTRELLAP